MSPIRAEMRRRYPKDWAARSRFVRVYRARGRCEWCGAAHGEPHPRTGAIVVLTTAHVYDKRPEAASLLNLAALCQRCHNRHDDADRLAGRRARARGPQLAFWPEFGDLGGLRENQGRTESPESAAMVASGIEKYLSASEWPLCKARAWGKGRRCDFSKQALVNAALSEQSDRHGVGIVAGRMAQGSPSRPPGFLYIDQAAGMRCNSRIGGQNQGAYQN